MLSRVQKMTAEFAIDLLLTMKTDCPSLCSVAGVLQLKLNLAEVQL